MKLRRETCEIILLLRKNKKAKESYRKYVERESLGIYCRVRNGFELNSSQESALATCCNLKYVKGLLSFLLELNYSTEVM